MTRTTHVAAAVSSTTPSAVTATPAADTPVVTLAGIVTDIRTWFGLPALPANSPIPALPIPDPFASLWMGVRQIEYRINNRTPTANPTSSAEDPQTGVIAGNLNATDLDGDPLTYTVTTAPTHGKVTVNTDGSYAYTPDPDFALSGGPDGFSVRISEANAADHVHGIKGLVAKLINALSFGRLHVPDGSTTTAVVQLVVAPISVVVNHAPVAPTTQGPVTYDPVTGIATGTTGFTDPDGDPLTYTVTTNPTHGTVTVAANGTFTYTPTAQGRAQAATTPGLTDAFTVTASDGQLTTPTGLQVNVTPAVVVSGPVSINVGINPTQVVVTPDGSTVYVTNYGRYVSSGEPHVGDSVSVISTATNTVIKTIQVGNHPASLAITPDGSTVYVGNFDDATVSVISTATNTVVDTISVGAEPRTVVTTTDGAHVLVASGTTVENIPVVLSVIDTATNTVSKTIALTDISYPTAVVANSDGSVVYVTDRSGSYADVIVGGTVTRRLYTGGAYPYQSTPVSAVLDGNMLYVADDYYGQVTVIDLAANGGLGAITKRINLPENPTQIVRSLDGGSLYVGGGDTIFEVDVATGVVTTINTTAGASIQGITLSPSGTILYATNPGYTTESDDSLLVIPLT